MSGSGISEFAILSMSARSRDGRRCGLPRVAHARPPARAVPDRLGAPRPTFRLDPGLPSGSGRRRRFVRRRRPPRDLPVRRSRSTGVSPSSSSSGRRCTRLGRMPLSVPRRHVGGYDVVARRASPSALVVDEVVPWRPNRGLYLLVEQVDSDVSTAELWPPDELDELLDLDGVAGAWMLAGTSGRHARSGAHRLTVDRALLPRRRTARGRRGIGSVARASMGRGHRHAAARDSDGQRRAVAVGRRAAVGDPHSARIRCPPLAI